MSVPIVYFSLRFYGCPISKREALTAVELISQSLPSVQYIQLQWISEWRSAYWEVRFDNVEKGRFLEELEEDAGHNLRLHWLKAV